MGMHDFRLGNYHGQLSARELGRLARVVGDRGGYVVGGNAGTFIGAGGGQSAPALPTTILARIQSAISDGGTSTLPKNFYGFAEVLDNSDGTFTVPPSGLLTDEGTTWAVEISGNANVPVDGSVIAELTLAEGGDHYTFSFAKGGSELAVYEWNATLFNGGVVTIDPVSSIQFLDENTSQVLGPFVVTQPSAGVARVDLKDADGSHRGVVNTVDQAFNGTKAVGGAGGGKLGPLTSGAALIQDLGRWFNTTPDNIPGLGWVQSSNATGGQAYYFVSFNNGAAGFFQVAPNGNPGTAKLGALNVGSLNVGGTAAPQGVISCVGNLVVYAIAGTYQFFDGFNLWSGKTMDYKVKVGDVLHFHGGLFTGVN